MTNSETELNQAREWHRKGDIARALATYEAVIEAEPDNPQACHLLGVVAQQQGDPAKAIDWISRAIALQDDDPQFHNNLGEALRAAGRHGEALESYSRARAIAPDFAIAINNQGATHLTLGQGAAAIQCFRDAMAAEASFLPAHVNLGLALFAAGDPGGALTVLTAPLAAQPENNEIRRYFTLAVMKAPAAALTSEVAARIETLFQGADAELQRLVRPALMLLGQRGGLEKLARASDGDIMDGRHDSDLSDNLLHALLTRTVLANAQAEDLLTRLRRLCLLGPKDGLVRRIPEFAAALAQQCFVTDYAYAETAAESDAVGTLIAEAEDLLRQGVSKQTSADTLITIAMYRPLGGLAGIDGWVSSPELGPLLHQQRDAPAEDALLAASVAELSGADSNAAVRRQYEEAPYPRWLSTDQKSPVPLAAAVAALFPALGHAPIGGTGGAGPRILVAGCGTGKQAIDAARQYHQAQVTAIDISRASLGYAQRMTAANGVSNIEFLRADIMNLDNWQARFDLVECSGVLHHLIEPESGWRNLCGLLAPGGLMKVALYSTLGRRDLAATRDFVAADNDTVTPNRIRRARADILALPVDDPRRRVAGFSDFYSLRGCRDLLFNVQEREYSLLEIASMMCRLNLNFIGFQFSDSHIPARFRAANPGARLDDLALWHEFETDNPDIFTGMYQFWCRPSNSSAR